MSYKLNIYTAYVILQQKNYEKSIAGQVVVGAEHAYKSSKDGQSWGKKV